LAPCDRLSLAICQFLSIFYTSFVVISVFQLKNDQHTSLTGREFGVEYIERFLTNTMFNPQLSAMI